MKFKLDIWFEQYATALGLQVQENGRSFLDSTGMFNVACVGIFSKGKQGSHTTWMKIPVDSFYEFMNNTRKLEQ